MGSIGTGTLTRLMAGTNPPVAATGLHVQFLLPADGSPPAKAAVHRRWHG